MDMTGLRRKKDGNYVFTESGSQLIEAIHPETNSQYFIDCLKSIQDKRYIIDLKIRPYFEKKILSEITVADVRAWQNELLMYKDKNGKSEKPVISEPALDSMTERYLAFLEAALWMLKGSSYLWEDKKDGRESNEGL